MKRIKSANKYDFNKFKVSNTYIIKKGKNNYRRSFTNFFSFNDDNNEFSIKKDFSSTHNHENNEINYKSDFFSPIIRGRKPSTRKEVMIFTEELLNKLNNGDKIGEDYIKESLKDLKLSQTTSLNDNNNNSQEVLDKKGNIIKANVEPKLFLTSSSSLVNKKTKTRKQIINLKRNKSNYYSPKTSNKTYKLFNKNLEKPIELLLREKEYEFERNYKTPKSIILLLNNFYKNSNMEIKKISKKNKLKYKYIKSDLEQKTLTIEKREKFNLFKLKKYSKFQKYYLGAIKHTDKIKEEINRFRDKHYSSSQNLEIYKKYKKSLLEENDINLLGCVDLRDYKKNKM